jgi:predicted dehydrogenase
MKRREFLTTGALGLAASTLPASVFAQQTDRPKRVGLIGAGWYGKVDLYALCQVAPVEVVAIADVDSKMLSEAAQRVAGWKRSAKEPRKFTDYREMLANNEFDIVLIGTPDHWHALTAIAAMEHGADIYLQKPISVDVVEGQAILAAARKHQRVVQVGTQRRSTPHLVQAIDDVIHEGKLGKIGHVEIYCYYGMGRNAHAQNASPPPHLDYDLWTGPAPLLPFNPLMHPKQWRLFREYGNGIMGDMCVHMLDMVRWMLDLGWPKTIHSTGGIHVAKSASGNITDTQTATFEYPEFDVVWTHRTWGTAPDPMYPWGATIFGEHGTLKASVRSWDFVPSGNGETIHRDVLEEFDQYPQDLKEPGLEPQTCPANRRHQQDFLAAIAERGRPIADVEQGYISSASCILANLSMQLGRSLTWDSTRQKVTDDEEANDLLARSYRPPWKHPDSFRLQS